MNENEIGFENFQSALFFKLMRRAVSEGAMGDLVHVHPAAGAANLPAIPSAPEVALGWVHLGADGRLFVSAVALELVLNSGVRVALLLAVFHASKREGGLSDYLGY